MTGDDEKTRIDILRGKKKALEEASLGSDFYSIESTEQLERLGVVEACDTLIVGGQVIIDEFLLPTRKKLQHRGTKNTDGIRNKCKENLPLLKQHLENHLHEVEELINTVSNRNDDLKLPETHLEMLERFTLLSHRSIILNTKLRRAQSDLNYIRGELSEDD
jgi:tRNA U34 5-carboxymethylaminomethyl modifying GTPase MnmE/TrmE